MNRPLAAIIERPRRSGLLEDRYFAKAFREATDGDELIFLRSGTRSVEAFHYALNGDIKERRISLGDIAVLHANAVAPNSLNGLTGVMERLPPEAVINRSLALPGFLSMATVRQGIVRPASSPATSRIYVADNRVIYGDELYADGNRVKRLRSATEQETRTGLRVIAVMADIMGVAPHTLALSMKLGHDDQGELQAGDISTKPRRYYHGNSMALSFMDAEVAAMVKAL